MRCLFVECAAGRNVSQYNFIEPQRSVSAAADLQLRLIHRDCNAKLVSPKTHGCRGQSHFLAPGTRFYVRSLRIDRTRWMNLHHAVRHFTILCPESFPTTWRHGRRLTLSEYRMGHLTAIKLVGR